MPKRKNGEQPEQEGILAKLGSLVKGDRAEKEDEGEEPRKATDMLKKDHDKVRALFKQYKETDSLQEKSAIARRVSQELTIHAHIEEEIFYPAVQKSRDEDAVKMVRESFEEHKIVKTLIAELAQTSPSDPQFEAKFTVLTENVEHHADEEESDLFPDAESDLGDDRLLALGAEMLDRKEELRESFENPPSPKARASAKATPRPSSTRGRFSPGRKNASRPRA